MIKYYQWTLQANNYKWLLVTQSSTKQKTTKNETSKQRNKKMFPVAGGGT